MGIIRWEGRSATACYSDWWTDRRGECTGRERWVKPIALGMTEMAQGAERDDHSNDMFDPRRLVFATYHEQIMKVITERAA